MEDFRSLKKDIRIENLLIKLKNNLEFNLIEIVDYWDADLCAIGIKKGDKLVYISNYNYVDNKELKFDYDFEIVNKKEVTKLEVIKEFRDKFEIELLNDVKMFFSAKLSMIKTSGN